MSIRTAVTLILFICCTAASAQIIGVKTYPILVGDAFLPLPSEREAMGGISIALSDRLRDPFINPAEMTDVPQSYATGFLRRNRWEIDQLQSSGNHQIDNPWETTTQTRRYASNVSLPVAIMLTYESIAIGAIGSYQHLISSNLERHTQTGAVPVSSESVHRADHYPYSVGAAVKLPGTGISLGAGISMIHIHGLDGIQFLYPDAQMLQVTGSEFTYRFGITQLMEDSSKLSVVGGRMLYETFQQATYANARPVDNQDKNQTWFADARYRMPLSDGVDIGLQAAGNWKQHPKIPDYPITGIPRDPGTTTAYNFGAGIAWKGESSTTLALEYLIEPVASKTWVEAAQDQMVNGRLIHASEVTQRNNYTFLNHRVRFGAEIRPTSWLVVRGGSTLHYYSYDYEFINLISNIERHADPQMEWTEIDLTGGITASIGPLELGYQVSMLTGAGILDRIERGWGPLSLRSSSDFFLPPNPWVQLQPVPAFTHQVSTRFCFDLY
jgi:hypothetical protein